MAAAPDAFAPVELFSFPLFSSLIAGAEQHKDALTAEILALSKTSPGVRRSNRNAWHSGDELVSQGSVHVRWVLERVQAFGRLALARYYQDWATTELRLGTVWANVLGPSGWNAPHHHFPQHWSGVFYVSVGTVGTSLDDMSGMIEFLNPTPWLSAIGRGGNFFYAPKDGLTMLFPASLLHFVHPHTTDEPRISIAYNFNVVPRKA
jgi:uncharacterized protein (TIGR02466 family)